MRRMRERKWRENLKEKAAVMDANPQSEGLYSQDPPRPPCVPVSPRPRDKVFPGVPPVRRSVPVSCPAPRSGVPPGGTPQVEVLLGQVSSMQKGELHQAMEQELVKAQGHCEELRQQLEQQSLQRARLHKKEMEAKGQRCSGLCLEQQQDLEGTEQELQQLRHLRREQRWQYCQQLEAIMEEHKHLHKTHAPAHLKAELVQLQKKKEKWLSLERRVLEAEEHLGPEAAAASRLVQEEQERAERQLEVELGRQQLSRQRRDRLAEELQQLQSSLKAQPE
ncbi:synaptonemal complex central element protein 1 [Sylvia borin]